MTYFIPESTASVAIVASVSCLMSHNDDSILSQAGDLNRCKKWHSALTASEDICRNFATNDHNRSGPRYLVWTELLCQFKRQNSWQNWKLSAAFNKSQFSVRLIVWTEVDCVITNLFPSLQVPLSDVWLSTCISDVSEVTLDSATSFVIGWPINNAVITFRWG